MSGKAIVVDANILIRAVLGRRVRELILDNAATVKFFAPDVAYAEARKYLPELLQKRGVDAGAAMLVLDRLEVIVHAIDVELYRGIRSQALKRIAASMLAPFRQSAFQVGSACAPSAGAQYLHDVARTGNAF